MKRTHRPGILLTIGAVAGSLGCTGLVDRNPQPEPPFGNPPPPEPEPTGATFPKPPFSSYALLEPRDAGGRVIHHGGGTCWVELPYEEAPTSFRPPPTSAVACPPEFATDPAYVACEYGQVQLRAVEPEPDCVCNYTGNPPPPSKDIDCPVVTFPSLARPG